MDSAGRNFVALAGISTVLAADAICGLAAYVLMPLIGGSTRVGLVCLLPAIGLGGLLAFSIWLGASALIRHLSASRRLARRIRSLALPPTPELLAGAGAAGLAGRIDLVNAEVAFSFTYGLLTPRVAISRGLARRLTAAELRATLEHERYHLDKRDPLRSLIATVLQEALFLLPALAVLRGRYEAGRELAADRRAEERCGRRSLVGALLKALERPEWADAVTSAPLGSPDLLSVRLARIETGRAPRLANGGPATLLRSVLGVGLVLACFAAAIAGVSGAPGLDRAVASELSPAGPAFAAACALPTVAFAALGYWAIGRLSFRAAR